MKRGMLGYGTISVLLGEGFGVVCCNYFSVIGQARLCAAGGPILIGFVHLFYREV
jgi:hypothetical protein